jgi:hypothetical protein
MSDTPGTNLFTGPLYGLANLLALCPTWQGLTWVAPAVDPLDPLEAPIPDEGQLWAAAMNRIRRYDMDVNALPRPYALIMGKSRKLSTNSCSSFGHSGELLLGIEVDYNPIIAPAVALESFERTLGKLVLEMTDIQGTTNAVVGVSALAVSSIEVDMPEACKRPIQKRNHSDAWDEFLVVTMTVTYGGG